MRSNWYVKEWYICESIRLISDILEYEHGKTGISFSADFEKAFKSIQNTFIFSALKSFGLGPQFIPVGNNFSEKCRKLCDE